MRLLFNFAFNKLRYVYLQCICLVSVCLFSKCEAVEVHPDIKWIEEYFFQVNENTPIEEIADHVVQLKLYVQSFGYATPTWDEFIGVFKQGLGENSDLFSDHESDNLKAILINREMQYVSKGYGLNISENHLLPYNKCGLKSVLSEMLFPFNTSHKRKDHKKKAG